MNFKIIVTTTMKQILSMIKTEKNFFFNSIILIWTKILVGVPNPKFISS